MLLAGPAQVATAAFTPSLPGMARDLGVATQAVQLGVTAYIAAFAIGQLPAGRIADTLGRRPVALAGAVVFAAAAGLSALAGSVGALIACRVAEGAGAGAMLVAGRAAMRDGAGGPALARVTALVSMWVWVLGAVTALLAGVLQDAFGWRANMLVTAAFGVAILAGTLLRQHETRPQGVVPEGLQAWLPVLRSRPFWRWAGGSSAMIGAFYAFLTGGPALLVDQLGVPAKVIGLYQLGAVAAFCASALGTARLMRGRPVPWLVPAGTGVAVAASAWLLALPALGLLAPAPIALGLIVLALGAGLVMPIALAGAVDDFPDRAGTANAAASLLQTVGAGVGSAMASLPGDRAVTVPASMVALTLLAAALFAFLARHQGATSAGVEGPRPVDRIAADP